MNKIEEAKEASWQTSRGEETYDKNYPVKASSNYADGYKAGVADVLQSQWISVKERLPKPGGDVLLYDSKSILRYVIGWLREKQGDNKSLWCLTNGFVEDDSITHWMPIPPLPETRKENNDENRTV